jgi:hypothetical protein
MSQRISLTRIIALNWYGFRQIFDVEDNVLISGAFGTGKSALLDLLQYVLLGEHWKANRAAAGNARGRDLLSYCLGDTNQSRGGQRHFLRESGVSFAALEFTRPAEKNTKELQRETWGIRIEFTSPDAAVRQTYFCIPERVEYAMLAPDGKNLLSEEAFRSWLRREHGNESLFARQHDYLEEMAAPRHLHFDTAAFMRTFPKAIAFEPEENVETFIRQFILEESPLDVRDVRTALRAYDDTRRRLEKQEDEAAFLGRIAAQHELYTTSRRAEAVLQQTFQNLRLLQTQEHQADLAGQLKRMETDHAGDLEQLDKAIADEAAVRRLLDEVRFEISGNPDAARIAQLESSRAELQAKVAALRESRLSLHQQLDARHERWIHWLRHGAGLALDGLGEVLAVDDALLLGLRSGTDAERLEAMHKLAVWFNEAWTRVQELLRPLDDKIKQAKDRLQQLNDDLGHLAGGRAPGAFPLFTALRQKLGDRVEQLGRFIEVKPEAERWWPLLESILGPHRWTLVVKDPADYRAALGVLRTTAPGREPEFLLNPVEIRASEKAALPDSLFSKVEISNAVVRPYVGQMLGDVVCCEKAGELESNPAPRAVSPDGLFKDAPLRQRLKVGAAVELTLGREGLERMRAAKQRDHEETRALHDHLSQRRADVRAWLDSGRANGLADFTPPARAGELAQLPELEINLSRACETIRLLMTPELEARQNRLKQLEAEHKDALSRAAVLTERKNNFELAARPVRESLGRSDEECRKARLDAEAGRVELSRCFPGILDAELNAERDRFRSRSPKWGDCFAAVQAEAKAAGEKAVGGRAQRNAERERLATARDSAGNLRHPEYQRDFPSDDESNEAWANRLSVLETIELEKSRQLAADCKLTWERRLEENVLNELNSRIASAEHTIRLLDRYLSQPIGKYLYRISQRRDMAGYGALWRLLDTGLEPTDPLLAAVDEGEVQRAKDELMKAVDAPDNSDDRARRLLDYRNYNHYDLEMVPADRPDAPPISLGRSGRNLSGGENQAPFFISMLAAFRRVYDRGDRSSTRSQQLGLVVMDEAFSKLSGDGIEDCLALAKDFQLQLVMAFPPERLGVMVPHAQTVVMCQKEVVRDAEGYVTRIDNIPLLTTMAEALEVLS